MERQPPTWHPSPSAPSYTPPAGAVDAHCHVFGPEARFPFAATAKYRPSDAPKEALFKLRAQLGFERSVLVQASCHGTDNAAMVDALRADPEHSRGVAVVAPDIDRAALTALRDDGVRGVRFNFLRRLVDVRPPETFVPLARLAADLGLHVVVYFEAEALETLTPFLRGLPTTVVIDHMGRPDLAAGVDGAGFSALRKLVEDPRFVVKVGCPERLSRTGPPYDDVAPFAKTLVADHPDKVLWGTDWPHPNMTSHQPDDGLLVDRIPVIAPSREAQRKLLVDNPARLYFGD